MIAGIHISQEIFAIDMLTALNPLQNTISSMLCNWRLGLTEIKLHIKTSPTFPIFLCIFTSSV